MAEHQQETATGGTSSLLGLSFARRHAYQRTDSEDDGSDINLSNLDSAHNKMATSATATHLSPNMGADMPVSPSTIHSTEHVNHDDRAVSPVTIRNPEHHFFQAPEIPVSPATPQDEAVADPPKAVASTARKASKKSKFTEMLKRSLSSSWDKRVASGPGFETTLDGPTQGNPYNSSGTVRDPNYLQPIDEYDTTENRDDTDNFLLKYST